MPDTSHSSFVQGTKGPTPTTSAYIIAAMRDGSEWSIAGLYRHLKARNVKRSYYTVKKTIYKLLKRGVISRVRRGWYRLNGDVPTSGVGRRAPKLPAVTSNLENTTNSVTSNPLGVPKDSLLPRVHDLIIVVDLPRDLPLRSIDESYKVGRTHFRFTVGVKRSKFTAYVSNDFGLDYDGFTFAIKEILTFLASQLNYLPELSEMRVVRVHFNVDYLGFALDGVKSLTVQTLDGMLARVYQKGEALRHEVQPSGEIPAPYVMAMLQGTVTGSQALSAISGFLGELRTLVEEIRWLREQNKQFLRFQQALLQRMGGVS